MAEGSKRPSLGQIVAAGRRRLREAVDDCIDRPYLPQPPDDTDLFLVAYPKSGINWLKWLMATDEPSALRRQAGDHLLQPLGFHRRSS